MNYGLRIKVIIHETGLENNVGYDDLKISI